MFEVFPFIRKNWKCFRSRERLLFNISCIGTSTVKTEYRYASCLSQTVCTFHKCMKHLGVERHSGFQWLLSEECARRQKFIHTFRNFKFSSVN